MDYEEFCQRRGENVSRETFSKIEEYVALLVRWSSSINLIGFQTIKDVWNRHILDSAQLSNHLSPGRSVCDIGSGAGLPGLVLAIMGNNQVILTEKNYKKCAFLRHVIQQCHLSVRLIEGNLDQIDIKSGKVDYCVSRAFSSLCGLFPLMLRMTHDQGEGIFLKGESVHKEIEEAQKEWSFNFEKIPSITNPVGVIIKIRDLKKGIL